MSELPEADNYIIPIRGSSGIAFHGAAATGDVDIQQRLEEHLAHCALLTAVAQDATWRELVASNPQLPPSPVHGRATVLSSCSSYQLSRLPAC